MSEEDDKRLMGLEERLAEAVSRDLRPQKALFKLIREEERPLEEILKSDPMKVIRALIFPPPLLEVVGEKGVNDLDGGKSQQECEKFILLGQAIAEIIDGNKDVNSVLSQYPPELWEEIRELCDMLQALLADWPEIEKLRKEEVEGDEENGAREPAKVIYFKLPSFFDLE